MAVTHLTNEQERLAREWAQEMLNQMAKVPSEEISDAVARVFKWARWLAWVLDGGTLTLSHPSDPELEVGDRVEVCFPDHNADRKGRVTKIFEYYDSRAYAVQLDGDDDGEWLFASLSLRVLESSKEPNTCS